MSMKHETLSRDYVIKTLEYVPDTGVLLRKKPCPRTKSGAIAGSVTPYGYRYIQLKGKKYAAHRLVWLIEHGCFPEFDIDHIDGNKLNNRITNLRDATRMQNSQNRGAQKNNKFGLRGVSYNTRLKKYIAQIQHDGVNRHLGVFMTPEEAHDAYIEAAKSLFTHFRQQA